MRRPSFLTSHRVQERGESERDVAPSPRQTRALLAASGCRPARMGLEGSSFRAATSTPSLTKQQPTHTHVKSDQIKSESESQLLPINNGNHHHGYGTER